MFFTLPELMSCLGLSIFELWLNLISFTIFTFLLAFKLDDTPLPEQNWWLIFLPLFIADALNCYFCIIVFIRMYISRNIKKGLTSAGWSLCSLILMFAFKFLLCRKLYGQNLACSEVISPIFVLLQLLMARTCRRH